MLQKIQYLKAEDKNGMRYLNTKNCKELLLHCVVFQCHINHVPKLVGHVSPRCLLHSVHVLQASKNTKVSANLMVCVYVYTGAARVFVVGRMGERANYISIFCTVTLAPVPVQRGPKVASLFKGAEEGR